jgi:hypothetical protein
LQPKKMPIRPRRKPLLAMRLKFVMDAPARSAQLF